VLPCGFRQLDRALLLHLQLAARPIRGLHGVRLVPSCATSPPPVQPRARNPDC
jgi:hypothetical protein